MQITNPVRCLLFCAALIIFLPFVGICGENTVLIFPPDIHSETPMDFLEKGMVDLMEARLNERGFQVIRADRVDTREKAMALASGKEAGSFVTGSLTFFGSQVSITLFCIDARSGENRLAFSRVEKNKDKVFDRTSEFIDRITGQPSGDMTRDVNKNEESKPEKTPVVPVAVKSELNESLGEIFRSQDVKTEINAIAVGNLKGDSQKSIVFTDRHSTFVCGFENGKFTTPIEIKGKDYLENLFVDTWDANGNGKDEIVVTAIHGRTQSPASYAYEWDGGEFALITKDMPWFFRKLRRPDNGKLALLGQIRHFSTEFYEYFDKKASVMVWDSDNRTYISGETFSLPVKGMNVYGFAAGDLMNDGSLLSMIYSESDYLMAAGRQGEEKWSGSRRFGGSIKFLKPRNTSNQERYYLPARIMAGDFNGDGYCDVITLSNENSSPRVFSNLKNFVEGDIVCLGWKTLDFENVWKTQDISGYLPDFYIDDLDSDGKYELIYSVVPKKKSFMGSKTSYLVVQTIL